MPNWVENTLTIVGDDDLLAKIADDLATPHTVKSHKYTDEGVTWELITVDAPLSFWNIIAPSPSSWDVYFSDNNDSKWNWYSWNVANWGCKWNASQVTTNHDDTALVYQFETPWSPPEEAMKALAAKYPDAGIHLKWVEEQGFGAEWVFEYDKTNGHVSITVEAEWGIPISHAEEMKIKGYCWACNSFAEKWMDAEDLYPDCPGYVKKEDK